MIRFYVLILIFLLPLANIRAGVHVWFPDTLACQDTDIHLPVYVSSVQAADSIVAYECTIEYDSTCLQLLQIDETGSMVQPWGTPFFHSQDGSCMIAGFTSNSSDQQILDLTRVWLFFDFQVNSDTSLTTQIKLPHFRLYTLSGEMTIDSLTSGQLNIVVNFPPEVESFPGVNILEDHSATVPLNEYVHDPNDAWNDLDIVFEPVSGIQTDLDPDGLLTIQPEPDWSGVASISFEVTDILGEQAVGHIDVRVIPVSDDPLPFSLIVPQNDTTLASGTRLYQFQWEPSVNVDPADEIQYRFYLSEDSLFHSQGTLVLFNLNTTEISINQTFTEGTYFWAVMAEDREGKQRWCDTTYRFHVETVSGFQSRPVRRFQIGSSAPNPFNHATTIRFQLDRAGDVTLDIIDVRGVHVRSLMHQRTEPGYYSVRWDGLNESGQAVSSGMYWAVLKASDRIRSVKICVVR